MFNQKQTKEQKKRDERVARLKRLLGVDFCACSTMYYLKCEGSCRKSHTDDKGQVNCYEMYQVDYNLVKPRKKNRKSTFRSPKNDERERRKKRDPDKGRNRTEN